MEMNEWKDTCKTLIEDAYDTLVEWPCSLEAAPSESDIDRKWKELSAAAEASSLQLWPADFEKFGGFNCL